MSYRITSAKQLAKIGKIGIHFADWYSRALREIRIVCDIENWELSKFVDVLAITSPRVAVRRNVRITLQYMNSGALFPSTMGNIRASLDYWLAENEIRGPKTEAFRRAILGDTQAIVLDVWMAKALHLPQKLFSTKQWQLRSAKRIQASAKLLKLSPRDAQAAIWAGQYQLTNGTPAPYFPILAEYQTFVELGKQYPKSGSIDNFHKLLRKARFDARQKRLFAEV